MWDPLSDPHSDPGRVYMTPTVQVGWPGCTGECPRNAIPNKHGTEHSIIAGLHKADLTTSLHKRVTRRNARMSLELRANHNLLGYVHPVSNLIVLNTLFIAMWLGLTPSRLFRPLLFYVFPPHFPLMWVWNGTFVSTRVIAVLGTHATLWSTDSSRRESLCLPYQIYFSNTSAYVSDTSHSTRSLRIWD